jgi:hypothetical protein
MPRSTCCAPIRARGRVARGMMLEAQEIAEKLGVKFPIDVDRRIDGGAAVGAHRTSMLQDLDGPPDGDRRAGGLGAGAGPRHRHADAHHRHVLALIRQRAKR